MAFLRSGILTLWLCILFASSQLTSSLELASKTRNKTVFIDLNFDVLQVIFESLDLDDFFNMIKVNSKFLPISKSAFRNRYRDYTFDVTNVFPNETISDNYLEYIYRNRVEMPKFNIFLEVMIKFGSEIQKLNIQNEFIERNKLTTINHYINKYGSRKLTHLKLGKMINNTLEQFVQPFKMLSHLSMTITDEPIQNGTLPLNELFPQLRHWTVIVRSGNAYASINCHIPSLEHLTIVDYVQRGTAQMEEIMKRNPHIKSVEVQQFMSGFNLMKKVNELLPEIENLTLHMFDIQSHQYNFNNVKHFTLHAFNPVWIEKASFPRLESLEMKFSPGCCDEWAQFFRKHMNLTRLLLGAYDIEKVEFVELLDELPNLSEMEIISSEAIDVKIIGQLIENHKKLEKFRISYFSFSRNDMNTLRKQFQYEWHISDYECDTARSGLTFEKNILL